MDHAYSGGNPASDALLLLIDAVRLTIKNNPQLAAGFLAENAPLREGLARCLALIPASADKTPAFEEVAIPIPTEKERIREGLENHLDTDNLTPDEKKRLREAEEDFLALFETPKQPPRNDIQKTVDNSPSDSMEIDPIIPKAPLPRWSALPPMVSPTPMNGRKSALVIEYDKTLSLMFTKFLKSDHYLVRTAYESEDALRLYRDCAPFEVVLIDYCMPKRNAIDIGLDILKQDPAQPMIIFAPGYQSEDEVPRREELMNVPFLLDMSNSGYSRFREILEKLQPRATREEVDWAITALTTAELVRLRKYADRRVCLFRGTDHRTGEDLLQEAKLLTVEGHRCWKKRVTFFTHLMGVMRSITRRRKGDNALLACDTYKDDADGQEYCLVDNVTASDRNKFFGYASSEYDATADQRLIATETMNRIFVQFMDDPEALLVLQGWSEGTKKKEIMQRGLSENQYRAAVKRIRMKLLTPTNGGGGGEKHDR